MRLRELTASGKPRRPENIITVSDEVWFRLQQGKKCRWEPVDQLITIKNERKRRNSN